MAHYFEPPIDTGIFLGDLEKERKPRKRKRRQESGPEGRSSDDEDDPDNGNVAKFELKSQPSQNDPQEYIQPAHFPLADWKKLVDKSNPQPRLNREERNLKHQHFNVLNTVLHKSLQDHDYKRARRAFASLLRFEIDGKHVDLRKKGLWGIGAEILLRKSSQGMTTRDEILSYPKGDTDLFSHGILADEGFKAARQFLDRLIVHYPYRDKRSTKSSELGARQFHPMVIALRIFQSVAESRRILEASDSAGSEDELESDTGPVAPGLSTLEQRAKSKELHQANEIRDVLDELILSPPYDKDTHLLRLRGNVGLWMRDLELALSPNEGSSKANEHLEAARNAFNRAEQASV